MATKTPSDTNSSLSAVERAMRLPQFRNIQDINEYELDGDGNAVRKDRFSSLCSNLASALYQGQKWSMTALKEHVSSFTHFFCMFECIEKNNEPYPADKEIGLTHGPTKYKVKPSNWLTEYAIKQDLYDIKEHNRAVFTCEESPNVDVILKDGSMISKAVMIFPVISKSGLSSPADVVWRGLSLKDDVVQIYLRHNHIVPFFLRFTRANLLADNEAVCLFEKNKATAEHEPQIEFRAKGF